MPLDVRNILFASLLTEDADITLNQEQLRQLTAILSTSEKIVSPDDTTANAPVAHLQIIQSNHPYRDVSVATDGRTVFYWSGEPYQYIDATGLLASLLHSYS